MYKFILIHLKKWARCSYISMTDMALEALKLIFAFFNQKIGFDTPVDLPKNR